MRPIFIGGCDRSGTSLLGAQLGRIEGVVVLPESQFISDIARTTVADGETVEQAAARIDDNFRYRAWRAVGCPPASTALANSPDPRALIENLVKSYAARTGVEDPRDFVDHSPINTREAEWLGRFFPDMKLLHIIRDGRAVAASLMPLDWGPTTMPGMADFWSDAVNTALSAVNRLGPERAMTVSYETLVADTDGALVKIARFLSLDGRTIRAADETTYIPPQYSAGTHQIVREAPDPARIDSWRRKMSRRQIELFERKAGKLLESLGYSCTSDYESVAPPSPVERFLMRLRHACLRRVKEAKYKRRHGL